MKNYYKKSLILSGSIFVLVALSPSVFAHAILVKSQPEQNADITAAPKQIDVWFNDKVGSEYKALAVIDEKGNRVDNKDVTQDILDGAHLYCTVPPLPAGSYTVRYRVVSFDTHIITGKYQFSIKTH
jgi:methionine-rich copper-binding protein CopC